MKERYKMSNKEEKSCASTSINCDTGILWKNQLKLLIILNFLYWDFYILN